MLIVVDNFEQVLEAAPVLADLLHRAPRLYLLVTSRVVLRVRGEQEWRVEPLLVPPAGPTAAALAEAPAGRLFVARVRDVQPDFVPFVDHPRTARGHAKQHAGESKGVTTARHRKEPR